MGRPQGYQNLATDPQRGAPADREIAAAAAACVGKRPRLGALWDLAHLSPQPARQLAAGRVSRRPHAPRGDQRGRPDARRAARIMVSPARAGGGPGARSGGEEQSLELRAQRKPLLFLTPHMGCFELTAQYAALRGPITVLYRPPKIAWLEPLM